MSPVTIYVLGALAALAAAFGLAAGATATHLFVMGAAVVAGSYLVGKAIALPPDRRFLPGILVAGALAKITGAWLRHWVLFRFYNGIGDAIGYHGKGLVIADSWRTWTIPSLPEGPAGEGTKVIQWFTGLLYAPYEPSLLGGFFLYSALALIGQICMYAAFRRSAPEDTWRRYLILVMFWPTLVYWPSSIGKEAFLMLFLGVSFYAGARLLDGFRARWAALFVAAVAPIGAVRIHLASILGASLLLAMLLSKNQTEGAGMRKLVMVGVAMAAMVPVTAAVASEFGVSLNASVSADDLDPFLEELERQTGQGGSAVQGGVATSIGALPGAVMKVLFRPFPWEAGNLQNLFASAEGLALLGLLAITAPRWLKELSKVRSKPWLMFMVIYSAAFVVAWSAILNLGIIARQRSLVVGAVLAIVAHGWRPRREPEPEEQPAPVPAAAVGLT